MRAGPPEGAAPPAPRRSEGAPPTSGRVCRGACVLGRAGSVTALVTVRTPARVSECGNLTVGGKPRLRFFPHGTQCKFLQDGKSPRTVGAARAPAGWVGRLCSWNCGAFLGHLAFQRAFAERMSEIRLSQRGDC